MDSVSGQTIDPAVPGAAPVEGVWTVVVAAGAGRRFGAEKQWEHLADARVIDRACATAREVSDGLVVVLPSPEAAAAWVTAGSPAERAVVGGATRSASVRAGLAVVPPSVPIVCIHDAARPLATAELFRRVIAAVRSGADGAVPGVAVTDTIKVVDGAGAVTATPDRSALVAVQTPQAFAAPVLREAHADGGDGTDDATLVERAGGRVLVVAGESWNRKLTERDDLDWARSWLEQMAAGENAVAS